LAFSKTDTSADAELRAYYAARAAEYDDDSQHPPERRSDLAYLRSWIPGLFAGKRVLDVACGTGAWTERIAKTAKHVVGVDINVAMLDIARGRGIDRARFVCEDVYDLGEGLGTFDAAFVGFWFSHVLRTRIHEFLTSLHRHLEPGAMVVVTDNTDAYCRTLPITEVDNDGNSFQLRRLSNGSVFRVLKNFPGESELIRAVTRFGTNASFNKREHFWTLVYETCA
jgi:demethylmenaquinone methyltransferase/2-methoxy-6-polyprenyl-1,4-benzoquinol methylase